MIVRIIENNTNERISISEQKLPDLTDKVISQLNNSGLSIRITSNYINYYINTETIDYNGDGITIKRVIREAQLFKLKKRSDTIKKLLNDNQ